MKFFFSVFTTLVVLHVAYSLPHGDRLGQLQKKLDHFKALRRNFQQASSQKESMEQMMEAIHEKLRQHRARSHEAIEETQASAQFLSDIIEGATDSVNQGLKNVESKKLMSYMTSVEV